MIKANSASAQVGGYIRPKVAGELMKAAQNIRRTVYIYGAFGYGKTSFVKNFLSRKKYEYYSMSDDEFLDAAEKSEGQPRIVVADDLHLLVSEDQRESHYEILEKLCGDSGTWLIMISRAPLPAWLRPLCIKHIFMMIGEQELSLSESEEEEYLSKWSLSLTPQSVKYLRTLTRGCPLPLRIAATELHTLYESSKSAERCRTKEVDVIENARKIYWDYLQTEVFNSWDPELLNFLTDLSVVESFNLAMARQITKRSDAGKMLLTAQETGSFISEHTKRGETIYEMRPQLRLAMGRRLRQRYSLDYIEKLYQSAGVGYELCGRSIEALGMYEKCHNEDGISRLLIANSKKSVGSGHYWEMRRYYRALSDETIRKSSELMTGMSLLESITMNDEQSERWYRELEDYIGEQSGAAKKAAQARLLALDIALPQRGTARMTDMLKSAWTFITKKQAVLPELSLTNNQPSLMNGGKDFCEWSKRDKALASSIGKPVELLLGDYGKGLVNIALSESFFEKGAKEDEVQYHAQKGWLQAASGGRPEIIFVAVGILAWQSVLNNRINNALQSLSSFRKSAAEEAPWLLQGIDTLKTRLLLYQGKNKEAEEWLGSAPDEDMEFCTLERYRYITKVRVYLAAGRNEKAISLLQKLLLYAEKRQRTYLRTEALILLAVSQLRAGEGDWKQTLESAVTQAEDYHFVRILTREGAAFLPLLRAGDFFRKDNAFKRQVMRECGRMAQFYPAYLSARQNDAVTLSDKALTVLRMQSEGKTVDQIAAELYLSRSGVKYYIQDTYKKLGVNSKVAALNEARSRGIL